MRAEIVGIGLGVVVALAGFATGHPNMALGFFVLVGVTLLLT